MSLLSSRMPLSLPKRVNQALDHAVEKGNGTVDIAPEKRSSVHTHATQRCSLGCVKTHMHHNHNGRGFQRPTMDTAASLTAVSTALLTEGSINASQNHDSGRRKIKLSGFGSILKQLPTAVGRRRKPLPEPQLRKKLKKLADKGDWDGVRKLLSGYEFPVSQDPTALQAKQEDEFVANPEEEGEHVKAARRTSYGSSNNGCGGRRSFTGKESAAAAAAIKAAFLEETSSANESLERHEPVVGDNALHDVCRRRPPLDVVRTLLEGLRHRRRGATTCGIDGRGRTPLHLAAANGASPDVVDALVREDPRPASVGDADGRSPLHLAVTFLATEGSLRSVTSFHRKGKNAGKSAGCQEITPEEALERTCHTVLKLKDTMLIHPGEVDFRDQDTTGRSPLDYVINADITNEELIQSLLCRKDPSSRSSPLLGGRYSSLSYSRVTIESNQSDIQDIRMVHSLEQDEVDEQKCRLNRIRQEQNVLSNNLFDSFCTGTSEKEQVGDEELYLPKSRGSSSEEESLGKEESNMLAESSDKGESKKHTAGQEDVINELDIYNQHLQDYMDDCMCDLCCMEGCENLEHADDDEFDITEDPSEVLLQHSIASATADEPPIVIDDLALLGQCDENGLLPSVVTTICDGNDCISIVSDITGSQ